MITYAWVPEQTFIDPLPFIFLQILSYRPRRLHLYLLCVIQALVYAFSLSNWGLFVFTPLLQRFYPVGLTAIQPFTPYNSYIWNIRGILGLVFTLALVVFLLALAKPSFMKAAKNKIRGLLEKRDKQETGFDQTDIRQA
jgi:hypothetical protein